MTEASRVAAAQTVPTRGDVSANLEQHVRLARAAAREGARLVVYPELSLTGYEPDLAEHLAFSRDDPRLAPLAAVTSSLRTTLVVGAPVRIGADLHIGAFIISPDRPADLYTKRHLGAFPARASVDGTVPPPEATIFRPGRHDPLVPFGDDVAAVAVCADTGRSSHPRRGAGRGATIYLASMFVIPSELGRETANLRACAVRHALTVVFANHGGPTGGLASGGGSAIWSRRGELLARIEGLGAGVVVAETGTCSGPSQT